MKTAILVDGAFYLQRSKKIWGNVEPERAAQLFQQYIQAHISHQYKSYFYRVFYYDCPPMITTFTNPVSHETKKYEESAEAKWRNSFHSYLKAQRKTALRLGVVDTKNHTWLLKDDKLKKLLHKTIEIQDIKPEDVFLDIRQKGVDMRLGLDIASLSYKKLVDQIILIAGDSDFVPAAKLARREGIDFVLDPMWQTVKADLYEHIDGLRSMIDAPDEAGNFSGTIRRKQKNQSQGKRTQ